MNMRAETEKQSILFGEHIRVTATTALSSQCVIIIYNCDCPVIESNLRCCERVSTGIYSIRSYIFMFVKCFPSSVSVYSCDVLSFTV